MEEAWLDSNIILLHLSLGSEREDDDEDEIRWIGCSRKSCGKWYHVECAEQHFEEEDIELLRAWYCCKNRSNR